ncbi:MAG: GGDEF domain-containing protein [Eubacteriales bacterium]|nr:GGDEF domain-containing protein [Eubacteriales bacterium]
MKKLKSVFLIGTLLLMLFFVASYFAFSKSRSLIDEGYLASEGNAAENFAVLAAANIHLTDAQVAHLKQMSYEELLDSEENRALQKMMSNGSFATKVDYAYIMIHLKDDEVKYKVTSDVQDRYDAPVGTKLDIMWLLDVNVSEETQRSQIDELHRYSYYIQEDAVIFGEAPTYLYNSSEWGNHICGYAPLYTSEGRYIGVLGVELQTGDYESYRKQAFMAMGGVLIVSLLLLSLLFLYIYRKYRQLQFEKIYTDALTKIYNRSYYNNQLIKRLNRSYRREWFALMIVDVDFFKKVNDTFGHEVGDETLVELAEILVKHFGREHVVRFGGEEFVIGLWIDPMEQLAERLDGLFQRIAEHRFSSREITLTVSLGCSYYQTQELHGWLLSDALHTADQKLYEAKGNGRNQYLIEQVDQSKQDQKANLSE